MTARKTRRRKKAAGPRTLTTADGRGEVRLSDARELSVEPGSARLVVGASVFLGKGVKWPDYEDLYRRVYIERCLPTLRRDGCLVILQTDSYVGGQVMPKNARLASLLLESGLELLDLKIWKRRRADHFQPAFSGVHVWRPAGGSATRTKLAKHLAYFQGVWDYPQAVRGPLGAYPTALCRLLVEAFTDEGDLIVDPFAGTSRLVGVAAQLGRRAIGYEIDEQLVETIEANLAEPEPEPVPVTVDVSGASTDPTWIVGDARQVERLAPDSVDLVFTCPPYYDLERYSEDPADLSRAATYEEFVDAWTEILAGCARRLREDRFLVVVVGEIRSREGGYRGLVLDTIRAAEAAGLTYYNDVVLVTSVGSLAVRAARLFEASRKLSKTHQNVLVFVKGSATAAVEAMGSAEYGRARDVGAPDEDLDPAVV